jgi:hypothetical protein
MKQQSITCNSLEHLVTGSGGNSISSNDLLSIDLDNDAEIRQTFTY